MDTTAFTFALCKFQYLSPFNWLLHRVLLINAVISSSDFSIETFQTAMPSMMTTCAAHQVRPEAHAVVLHLFAALIDFSPLLEVSLKKNIAALSAFAFLKYRLSLMFLEYVNVHEEESYHHLQPELSESRLLDAASHQDKHWSSGGETKLSEISPARLKAN